MKKDHKSGLDLSFGVHMGETNSKGKSEAKREACKGENSAAPFQAIHVKPEKIQFYEKG